ncbi:MAG: hypothetical protein SH868_00150 [Bythopirellula sp.]|nr:hypothetical protein [Bythopirellula sp.]
MSTDSQHILTSFSSLPEPEQRLVAAEILRRASQWNTEPLNDDDLDRAADEIFLELDRRETVVQ